MDIEYFDLSRNLILQRQELGSGGIGTLGEKTVHSTLKQYLSRDLSCQEIKIGSYYADVCVEDHIFEIQTRQFNKLRAKLDFFLTEHPVTVVYPITNYNYLRWVTPNTGEITAPKKSTRHGNPLQVFAELYRIRRNFHHAQQIFIVERGAGSNDRSQQDQRDPLEIFQGEPFQFAEDGEQVIPRKDQEHGTCHQSGQG